MLSRERKFLASLSLRAIGLSFIFLACLLLFIYIADENVHENENALDLRVGAYVLTHASLGLVRFMSYVTFFGSSTFLFPAYIILIAYFLWKKNKLYAISIFLIAASSTGIMFLLKQFFRRQRPLQPHGAQLLTYSFPSGHSVSSFVFCSILAWLLWKSRLRLSLRVTGAVLLVLFSLCIGLSRIILNVHFLTDVIAGFCFGIVWVLLSAWVVEKAGRKQLLV